jgi:uncharacterized membrane protein YfcA
MTRRKSASLRLCPSWICEACEIRGVDSRADICVNFQQSIEISMSPIDRASFPARSPTQLVPVTPWVCFSLFAFATLWSHANFASDVSLAIVFVSAVFSSIAGFAFAPLAGSMLLHVQPDHVLNVKIILVASIAQQTYCVWRLRDAMKSLEFVLYLVGSVMTLPLGLFLLLHSQATMYLPILGALLIAYGIFAMARPVIRIGSDTCAGRIMMGALGGLTGGVAAFPGAFVTIWCQAQGYEKERQRAIVQPFILINQLLSFAALSLLRPMGAFSLDLLQYAPPAILGACIGLRLFKSLSNVAFNRVVGLFLLIAGIGIVAKAI